MSVSEEGVSYEGREDKLGKKWAGDFSSDLGKKGYKLWTATQDKVIHFEGVGKVKIGNDPDCRTEYNRISIDLDPNISEEDAAAKLNMIFATLGLGDVHLIQEKRISRRQKVLQLFRAYYPKQAYTFERLPSTFRTSLESLKINIAECLS